MANGLRKIRVGPAKIAGGTANNEENIAGFFSYSESLDFCGSSGLELECRRVEYRLRNRLRHFRFGNGDTKYVQHGANGDIASNYETGDDQKMGTRGS